MRYLARSSADVSVPGRPPSGGRRLADPLGGRVRSVRSVLRHPWSGGQPRARSQVVARAVVLLCPFVAVAAGLLSGVVPPVWFLVPLAVLAVLAAAQPDSFAPGVVLGVLVLYWWLGIPSSSPVAVLVTAAAVVALHVAATLASLAPVGVSIPRELVSLWLLRGLGLWLVAVLAWAAGRLAASPSPVVVVSALLLVAAVAAWAALRYGRASE